MTVERGLGIAKRSSRAGARPVGGGGEILPGMDYAAVDAGFEPMRNQFLALTSAYRCGLERLQDSHEAGAVVGLTATSTTLLQVAGRISNSPLRAWSETLRRLTAISSALLSHQPARALEVI